MTTTTTSFQRGDIIAGKYRVERVIGEGGMGVVLKARHLGLGEMVAVKLIREGREGAPSSFDALARFRREARAVARIKSEHVARVLDVDRLPEGDPYIVMEFIDGTDLEDLIEERGGPLPTEEVATYILQACEGLAEAHALGMVHRDLKLKNLFLTKRRDGRPLIKVIDFGVVKLAPNAASADDSERTLRLRGDLTAGPGAISSVSDGGGTLSFETTTGSQGLTGAATLVGSVHYMAPEQIRASSIVDARADVWSLGVCMYALLTPELPFDGDSLLAVFAAIQGRQPRDVREIVPSIPAAMAEVVQRALEKDVRRRFANVAELAAAIAPFSAEPAAAQRVATILQSTSPSDDASEAIGEPDATLMMRDDRGRITAAAVAAPPMVVSPRAESTIDAAAASDDIARPVIESRRSGAWRGRLITVAIVLLALGAAVITLRKPLGLAVVTSHTTTATSSEPPPTPTPTPTAPASSPSSSIAAPDPSLHSVGTVRAPAAPSATTTPNRRRNPATTTTTTKASTTSSPSLPAPPPKTEPTNNAYDHF